MYTGICYYNTISEFFGVIFKSLLHLPLYLPFFFFTQTDTYTHILSFYLFPSLSLLKEELSCKAVTPFVCGCTSKAEGGTREERLHKWMLPSASMSRSGLLLCSYARNHCTFSWMCRSTCRFCIGEPTELNWHLSSASLGGNCTTRTVEFRCYFQSPHGTRILR